MKLIKTIEIEINEEHLKEILNKSSLDIRDFDWLYFHRNDFKIPLTTKATLSKEIATNITIFKGV